MNYLFIGLGSIGLRHLQNLRSLTNEPIYVLRRVADKSIDKQYNITSLTTFSDAYDVNPDVVFITNPTSKHIASAYMFSDSHLFIEKPLSTNSNYVYHLLHTLEKNNKVCFVGYNYRFYHDIMNIKHMIETNVYGAIYYVQVQLGYYLPKWHPHEDYRNSYAGKKELGGGPLLTLSHAIDYVYWLFGDVEKVYAQKAKVSSLEIDTEDMVSIILKMKSGIIVELHLDYLQPSFTHNIKIVSEKQTYEYNLYDKYKRDVSFVKELSHFLNCVSGAEKPKITHKDIKDVMRIIDDCQKSSILNGHSC